MRYKPHPYQLHATKHILEHDISGLLLDMGLGKTVSTLTAIDLLLFDYFEGYKALVIAPLRVAEDTWDTEASKWEHTRDLRISKILGPEKKRIEALRAEADIYIISRDLVSWLVNHYKKKWPFDMVVIDELSSFKSHSSQRFKELRKVRPFIKKIVGLTGTPTPNGLLDLWAQMYLLDQGERLGKTFTGYRDRFFEPARVGKNPQGRLVTFSYQPKQGAEEEIYRLIGDICISMKAEDWLEMPERISVEHKVMLSDSEMKLYKQLERDYILEFESGDVEASSAAVLSNKLLQLASGAVYDENKKARVIHDRKLDALEDILEASNGKPVLVAYYYKHDLERIKDRFKQAVVFETPEHRKQWNAGEIELMLIHPKSAAHGLNIQAGGNTIVWFTMVWSLEEYQQLNARLYRQGQTSKSVIIHHLLTEGTLDEDVLRSLSHKDQTQESLMAAVKARISAVKNES